MECYCLMRAEFQFCNVKRALAGCGGSHLYNSTTVGGRCEPPRPALNCFLTHGENTEKVSKWVLWLNSKRPENILKTLPLRHLLRKFRWNPACPYLGLIFLINLWEMTRHFLGPQHPGERDHLWDMAPHLMVPLAGKATRPINGSQWPATGRATGFGRR